MFTWVLLLLLAMWSSGWFTITSYADSYFTGSERLPGPAALDGLCYIDDNTCLVWWTCRWRPSPSTLNHPTLLTPCNWSWGVGAGVIAVSRLNWSYISYYVHQYRWPHFLFSIYYLILNLFPSMGSLNNTQ